MCILHMRDKVLLLICLHMCVDILYSALTHHHCVCVNLRCGLGPIGPFHQCTEGEKRTKHVERDEVSKGEMRRNRSFQCVRADQEKKRGEYVLQCKV